MNGGREETERIEDLYNIGLVGECYIAMEPIYDYYEKHNLCVHDQSCRVPQFLLRHLDSSPGLRRLHQICSLHDSLL
jgi:hypothetical protein